MPISGPGHVALAAALHSPDDAKQIVDAVALTQGGDPTDVEGILDVSAANALTAHAGGTQAAALALTAQKNRITICANAGDSVRLPTSVAGRTVDVVNATATAAQVFGAGTDTINGVATATGVLQPPYSVHTYHCEVAGTWETGAARFSPANTAISTVGAGTLTAAGVAGGVITRSGSTADYTDTFATAALILAAVPMVQIGRSWLLFIRNTVAFSETVATATGLTLTGNVIVPGLSVGVFLVTPTALTTVSIVGLGSFPICNLPNTKYATAALATGTLSAGQITGANHVVLETTTDGAASMATRTAAEMFGDIPNCQPGFTYLLTLINSGNNTLTITAGANVTLTGTMTLATLTTRTFVVTFTDATHVVIQGISKGTIEAT